MNWEGRGLVAPAAWGLSRSGWLAVMVVVLAFGVVSMHQLSSGHSFVTPASSGANHADLEGPQDAAAHAQRGPGGAVVDQDGAASVPAPADTGGCHGCARHGLLIICLLALVLLAALIAARGPTGRALVVIGRGRRRAVCGPPLVRPRAHSLVQLAVSRT